MSEDFPAKFIKASGDPGFRFQIGNRFLIQGHGEQASRVVVLVDVKGPQDPDPIMHFQMGDNAMTFDRKVSTVMQCLRNNTWKVLA